MASKIERLLTVHQVAEILAVHPSTVADMCRRGQLPHLRVGRGRGVYRFRPSDVERYVNSNVEPPRVESLFDEPGRLKFDC